jgi:hypothetical protein
MTIEQVKLYTGHGMIFTVVLSISVLSAILFAGVLVVLQISSARAEEKARLAERSLHSWQAVLKTRLPRLTSMKWKTRKQLQGLGLTSMKWQTRKQLQGLTSMKWQTRKQMTTTDADAKADNVKQPTQTTRVLASSSATSSRATSDVADSPIIV